MSKQIGAGMVDRLVGIVEQHPEAAAVTAVSAVALLVLVAFAVRRTARAFGRLRARVGDEQLLTVATSTIATGVAAQGMWGYFEALSTPVWLRVLFFAFLELMVVTSALRARTSMREGHGTGADGIAMWVLTCLSAVLSATHAASPGEVLLRLSAPLVAAWGWERSMALERRQRTGRTGINWRISPERVLIRLGLADPTDRTAGEVDAQRRIMRLAIAVKRARTASEKKRDKAIKRLDKAMEAAVEYGRLGSSADSRDTLLATLGALSNASELLTLQPPAPWHLRMPSSEASAAGQPRVHSLDESIFSARADGLSYEKIAKALEISKHRVVKALNPPDAGAEAATPDSEPAAHTMNGHTRPEGA